ncbi:aldo/keto reductase [Chelatococcus sp.]|nr:aldo/keto reductase [Chelatococcus sp.]MBS7700975.1 aldo/keto reductase [Chelatococcus sp. YT9]MBX3555508.1 aldo/keto reductase [Chelatococcus sp.]
MTRSPANEGLLPTRPLGRSGLDISVLGFGAAPLGGIYRSLSNAEAEQTVAAALDCGLRYFDVAPFYGLGRAERRLGDALRDRREECVLSTKIGRLLRPPASGVRPQSMYVDPLPFEVVFDYSYDGVMRSLEDSQQRMGLLAFDIVFIHDVNRRWHGDEVDRRFDEVMGGGYRALDELRRSGQVKAIGVGVNDSDILVRFADAGQFDCFMLAGRYTLLEQTPLDTLFPRCEREGISVIAAAPFNSGILATGARDGAKYFYTDAPADILDRTRRIEAICERHGVPLIAAALQFALGHTLVASVATGFSSPEEVKQAAEMIQLPIPMGFWDELKAAGLIRQDSPVRLA